MPRQPGLTEPVLTKKQLASHYRKSVRWVEFRVSDGMPSDLIGRQRYFRLSLVHPWLVAQATKLEPPEVALKPPSLTDEEYVAVRVALELVDRIGDDSGALAMLRAAAAHYEAENAPEPEDPEPEDGPEPEAC